MSLPNFQSVAEMFRWRVQETPNNDALLRPTPQNTFEALSWSDVKTRADAMAGGLLSLGLTLEQRVSILCSTRVDWVIADIGIMCAGGATTTIYPSNTPDECQFILSDSATRIIFCEDAGQVAKIIEKRAELPNLQQIIIMDGEGGYDGFVMTLAELESKGRAFNTENANALDERIAEIKREHLATLIYTSGTTGTPKGVELLHDCWVYTGESLHSLDIMSTEDRQFLWLPLSHSFGKVLEVAFIVYGVPTAIDGRVPKIVENLGIIQPTFMAAAPRIFEKVYNKVVTGAQQAGGAKLKIFRWSMAVGTAVSKLRQQGQEPTGLLKLKFKVADKLVFSKLRAKFGGRIRYFISGSAPLSREMGEFFHAAGMLICEGYGLTESSAASVINLPTSYRFGTVGQPVPGTEIKIDPKNGEILLRSRGVMRGYHNLPEVNAETIDSDGWLHTGDKGELDDDGKLRITDRIKNLIKTSGGKYVAPQHIEGAIKAACPLLSQVLVHGDRRNFCSALITIEPESLDAWTEQNELTAVKMPELASHPALVAHVQSAMDSVNATLPKYATIKKFAILTADLSIEGGELTPSMKVKRKIVEKRNMAILDSFYDGSIASI